MNENITPEEKLLKLIRGQKNTPVKQQRTDLPAVVETIEPKPVIKTAGYNLPQRLFYATSGKKIVLWCFALCCAFLIFSFISPYFGSKQIQLPPLYENGTAAQPKAVSQSQKPLEYYLDGIKSQNIFSSEIPTKEDPNPAAAATGLAKDITLVGIISGDNPQAVIEDKKNQKTYYLKNGQSFGEFRVASIQEGKIILENNGKMYELYL
jgi:type II secretory pathway component PulC